MIAIWDEVFFKIRAYFYGMVTRKELLLESSHRIESHLDMVVEVIEFHSIVSFELFLDENLIEFW